MIYKKIYLKNFTPIVLVALIFIQNPLWMMWGLAPALLGFTSVFLVILAIFHINKNSAFDFIVVSLLFLYFFIIHGIYGEIRLSTLIFLLVYVSIVSLDSSFGLKSFRLITVFLSIILTPSIILWFIFLAGVDLPRAAIYYGDWKGEVGENIRLVNYFLFIDNEINFIRRFYSYFDEPGVLGTLCAFLLYGMRYDTKKIITWVLLIGGILTFSLAFFILLIVGFIFSKMKAKTSLTVVFIFAPLVILINQNFDFNLRGDFTGVELVLYRFLNLAEFGELDRTGESFNLFFSKFIISENSVFGMGTSFLAENPHLHIGQSYKFFLVEYGFFGLLLIVLSYVNIIRKINLDFQLKFGLIAIFMLSFLQRPFLLTPWQLALFWMIAGALSNGIKYPASVHSKPGFLTPSQ